MNDDWMTMTASDDWMTAQGCGGALTMHERITIRKTARQMAAKFGEHFYAVNIGVDVGGGTLYCIRSGAPRCHLIGIDINPDSKVGSWRFIHGDSRRVHLQVEAPIHLLLIDGDHDYYGVRADIMNWTPKVPVGGVVIFHDYHNAEEYPWTAGVEKAVDEFMTADQWEIVGDADSIRTFVRKTEGLNT